LAGAVDATHALAPPAGESLLRGSAPEGAAVVEVDSAPFGDDDLAMLVVEIELLPGWEAAVTVGADVHADASAAAAQTASIQGREVVMAAP
jgi:hypothetical protein